MSEKKRSFINSIPYKKIHYVHTRAKIVVSNYFTFPPQFEMKFHIYFAPKRCAELVETESSVSK